MLEGEEAIIAMHPGCPNFPAQKAIYPDKKKWLQIAR